jgi:hypothetical protein
VKDSLYYFGDVRKLIGERSEEGDLDRRFTTRYRAGEPALPAEGGCAGYAIIRKELAFGTDCRT